MVSVCKNIKIVIKMTDICINIENLYKIFGNKPQAMMKYIKEGNNKHSLLVEHNHVLALNNINLKINTNQIHVIMGLSGSGKSTLVRHINRLIEPTSGQVFVNRENILTMTQNELREFRKYKVSMVFQKFGLLPHRTVVQNISFGLLIQGLNKGESIQRSQKWIKKVGLDGFENKYPYQLSGGMQQRVGLARALATDAGVLLMDEAFSALDPLIRTSMQDTLLDLQRELNRTIVFITHDLNEAIRIGDQISILHDGSIIQTGSPEEILLKPKNNYISDFIKDINMARIVKISSIMKKTNNIKGTKIAFNKTLEESLPIIASDPNHKALIVDKNDNIIGEVSLECILSKIYGEK